MWLTTIATLRIGTMARTPTIGRRTTESTTPVPDPVTALRRDPRCAAITIRVRSATLGGSKPSNVQASSGIIRAERLRH
jgi:hypothetical protein